MVNTRGYTYLITNGREYKIGITTKTPQSRVVELQTGSPTKITISGYSYNSNALEMEIELHRMFASKRLEGEWFALNNDDVAIIHHYFETNYLDEYFAPLSAKGVEASKREATEFEELIVKLTKLKLKVSKVEFPNHSTTFDDILEENKKYYDDVKMMSDLMAEIEDEKFNLEYILEEARKRKKREKEEKELLLILTRLSVALEEFGIYPEENRVQATTLEQNIELLNGYGEEYHQEVILEEIEIQKNKLKEAREED